MPLVLGVLRKLAVAQRIDTLIPPHPAHVVSCGRGVEALVLAILDGHHALSKEGRRVDELGMLPLLQPGLEPTSLHDTRLGQVRDALFETGLNQVCSQVALRALDTYAVKTPWMHPDTTTIALYGAYDEGAVDPRAPRPTYGQSKDDRGDLKQVLVRLGVSGEGGLPLRMGLRDGKTSESVEVPQAIQESLTLGVCLEHQMGLITFVPRTCAIRQEVEWWGQKQRSLPWLLDKPAPRRGDRPRRWYGRRVRRAVEVEYSAGRIALVPLRFVAGYSTQLAQQHAQASEQAQRREAEALAEPLAQIAGRRFACAADAEAAIAAYEGRGGGRRGRPARRGHYHEVQYQVEAQWQRRKRAPRGRPSKGESVEEERIYQLRGVTRARPWPVETFGWLVLATTLDEQTCTDAEIMPAYRDQTTTGEPGFRWMKNPAAISPVWLEKPERIAALAMLTVVGLLVYGVIQRQVRQYLQQQQASMPGNKGVTATPTATGVFESFAAITLVYLDLDGVPVSQVHGWQAHHQLICEALGGSDTWYEGAANRKNNAPRRRAP